MPPTESVPALTAPTTSAIASTGSTVSSIIISREPPTAAYGLPLAKRGEDERHRAGRGHVDQDDEVSGEPQRRRGAERHQRGQQQHRAEREGRGERVRQTAGGAQVLLAEELEQVEVGLRQRRPVREWTIALSLRITPSASGESSSATATLSRASASASSGACRHRVPPRRSRRRDIASSSLCE